MSRTVTMTIDEEGNALLIKGGADIFLELGQATTRRASHVLPANPALKLAFKALRACCHDTSKLAAWTRNWQCLWMVDARPAGGEVLEGVWSSRQDAIEAEIDYLHKLFLLR